MSTILFTVGKHFIIKSSYQITMIIFTNILTLNNSNNQPQSYGVSENCQTDQRTVMAYMWDD